MALTDIASAKDAQQSFQPLLLAVFTFHDGTVFRASTHPLSSSEGGYQYGGQNYAGRIISQEISAVQGYDSTGIDLIPRAAVTLADADKALKVNYEDVYGFAGAQLDLTFLFWDADSSTFSSDSIVKFRGICDPAASDAETMTVGAVNKLNLQRRTLPPVPLQRRCPWIFPRTVEQRQDGADNEGSTHYECGYSPDATGGNARGNFETGSTPFTACNYTKADCEARGMFKIDGSSRVTGRFGGIQWDTPPGSLSREYTSGKFVEAKTNPVDEKYGNPVPMVYGIAWVDAVPTNVLGDGNSTRGEAIVCMGEVESIIHVVVDGIELQAANDITGGTNYSVRDALLRYNIVNRGDRDGAPNLDKPYDGNGDPYGSMCTILWVVPRRVNESATAPRIRVLVQGPKLRVYSDTETYSKIYTSNPAWVLMDLLTWSGLAYDDLDIQTFIDAAAICAEAIEYTDQFGAVSTHARYSCSLVLRQRRSAADVIRAVRQGFGGILVPNSATGKLQLFVEGTLASQQPSAVTGSNYNDPVESVALDGTAADGYVAYDFTKFLGGRTSSLKIQTPPLASAPNRVQFGFANSERDWSGDSVSVPDTEAITRSGQEVNEQYDAEGIDTLDQAKRIAGRRLARNLRGNPRSDSGGTEIYTWLDSFRAVQCRVGHIIRLSDEHYGVDNVLARIIQMRPSTNFETVQVTAQRHNDAWYRDDYGQNEDSEASQQFRNRLSRPSYPWGPARVAAGADDPIFDVTDFTFSIQEAHEEAADGTVITRLYVAGYWPVNLFTKIPPPTVGRQGTTASSGGDFVGYGRSYYISLCALDEFGAVSAPSTLCRVVVTNASSTNTITIPILGWPDGAVGYIAYVGDSPNLLTEHASDAGATPDTITINSFLVRGKGIPDPEFDRMRIKVKRIAHSGCFGQPVDSVVSGGIVIDEAGWTADQWDGYDVSILGIAAGGELPILNFRCIGNTADTLSLTPDPDGVVAAGDAIIMRSKPTVGSDGTGNYIEDANWENTLENSGGGLGVGEEAGRLVRFIAGPGKGQVYRATSNTSTRIYIEGDWRGDTPDSTSRYIVEEPDWQVNLPGDSLNNADLDAILSMSVEVSNYLKKTLLVACFTQDGGANESFDSLTPMREIYVFGGPSVLGAEIPLQRTLLLKDTAVGDDIADHVTALDSGIGLRLTGLLRKAIVADLTVQARKEGVAIISLTIPLATAVDTVLESTTFADDPQVFTRGEVLSWDVLASDGSVDKAGVASFTLEWTNGISVQ